MLRLGWRICRLAEILAVSCGVSMAVMGVSASGLLQPLEWFAFDCLLRLQTPEKGDARFVMAAIGAADPKMLQAWPTSKGTTASLLQEINQHHSPIIRIDLDVEQAGIPTDKNHSQLSQNDRLHIPINRKELLPGVFTTHTASQLVGSGLNERVPLNGASGWGKTLWLLLATTLSVTLVYGMTYHSDGHRHNKLLALLVLLPCICISILGVVYGFFWTGLWLPVAAPLLSALLSSILLLLRQNQLLIRQNQQLHGLASIDGLTCIANRRSFDLYLHQCIYHREQLSLVLCDVDYFKRYNDTYGHQAGDRCLVSVAKILAMGVRRHDFVARYGGEEFVIVLPDSKLAMVCEMLRDIQKQMIDLEIPHKTSDVSPYVTLSFGIVFLKYLKGFSAREIIECADQALYRAKRKGRNQIVSAVLPVED